MEAGKLPEGVLKGLSLEQAYSREDEADDGHFYSVDRLVAHLDSVALRSLEDLIGLLVVEPQPAILDLMASWDSHIPESVRPSRVVGLGLNRNELERNLALDERVVHDLNAMPSLPFDDGSFDVVLNAVSVDYLTRPLTVFAEVSRVLRPGGLFLVMFSNRMFPEKAVRVWRDSSEQERVALVEAYFRAAGDFEPPRRFVSRGKPRPADDKYARSGLPSDPVYAVYADRSDAPAARRARALPAEQRHDAPSHQTLEQRRASTSKTLCCPRCGVRMEKWAVPQTPFTEWESEYMYICFNDSCPYYVKSWEVMDSQGNTGFRYRQMYDPLHDRLLPVPVPSPGALRAGIVRG